MNDGIFLSIIIPVYNEEESVELLYGKIKDICDSLGKTYEILFINDGSDDKTLFILKEMYKNDKRVKVVIFRRNYGQTAAMSAGFAHADGEIIISMDSDLQNDPQDIPVLLKKIEEGYDIVCGWRKKRKDKLFSRRIPSLIANRLIGIFSGLKIHDNGCSLKAYRSGVIKKLPLYSEMHRFIPVMASMKGARIAEVVVRHHPRKFGYAKYGISRVWKVFLDMFVVKMLVGFSTRPALWFATLSLPFLVIAFLFIMLSAVDYLAPASEDSFIIYPSVSFLLLFLFFQLNVLGVFSEFIIRTGHTEDVDSIMASEIQAD